MVHIGWCPVPNLRDGVLRKVRLGMEVALMEFFVQYLVMLDLTTFI